MKRKMFECVAAAALSGALFAAGCGSPQKEKTLSLEKERILLYVGEEETLRADGGEAVSGTFLSTAPDTVSVNAEGKIQALAVGSGVVIVRTEAGTAVCTVIVTGEAPVDLDTLKITGAEEYLTAGESVKLEYSKTPLDADNYNSIRWSSEDTEVASVDADGVLTALSPGRTRIVLAATGTNLQDSFELEVAARPNRLTLDHTDVCGIAGTSDLTLTADLFTDYKDVSAGEWKSDDPSVAAVENGEVRFLKEGKTTLRYVVTAGGERLEAVCAAAVVTMPGYTVVRTPEQLQEIGNTSGKYMLGNDIDLKEACAKGGALYHGGAGFSPLFSDAGNAFKGVFDGMGYAIKNLRIESSNAFTALFSYVSVVGGKEGVIRNLALDGGSVTGGHYSAALIGRCNTTDGSAGAAVENCFVRVQVRSFGMAAGLVGFNGGIVRNCVSLCELSGETTAAFTLRQCDNAEIGIDACVALEGGAQCLVPDGRSYAAFMKGTVLSETELKSAAAYAGWDREAWKIEDGSLPALRTPNQR